MATRPKSYITPEEYLTLERAAACKSEYINGEIVAMAGASEEHNTITTNLVRHIGNQFDGRSCRVYSSDMRVAAGEIYTYPDVVVVCGPRELDDTQGDTLLNPTVVFEVLSPSIERFDRGAKFAHYQQVESLTDYVLVAQDQIRVDHYTRQGDGWFLRAFEALADTLRLAAIDCSLSLAAIYQNVEFPTPTDPA